MADIKDDYMYSISKLEQRTVKYCHIQSLKPSCMQFDAFLRRFQKGWKNEQQTP